ncbi:MAG: pentapeptide repeat-containing protein, partial [Nostoc sp.]
DFCRAELTNASLINTRFSNCDYRSTILPNGNFVDDGSILENT